MSTHIQYLGIDMTPTHSLIPSVITLTVQVYVWKVHAHMQTVYFTRTNHEECKMILH